MSSDEEIKARQRTLWDRVARGGDQLYDEMDRLSRPVNEWICEAAGLRPGMSVLDIASGSGQPAFMAAQRTRPNGKVTATDISSEMVEALKERAVANDVSNFGAIVEDMDTLRFNDESFDAVTCRWGFMFSPQPVVAMTEAHRVLRRGGSASPTRSTPTACWVTHSIRRASTTSPSSSCPRLLISTHRKPGGTWSWTSGHLISNVSTA